MEDVLNYSAHIQLEAEELLAKTNLLIELSKFGEVKLIGSFASNLMFDPDIDVVLYCDQPRKCAVAALECLIKTELFSRYEFGDFVQFPRANRPSGYILVLQIPLSDKLWEIEIWFKSLNDHSSDDFIDLQKTINAVQRKTILEIKKERSVKELGKNKLSSVEIYEGVLLKGYKSISDFQKS